jgi:hypothetical protein
VACCASVPVSTLLDITAHFQTPMQRPASIQGRSGRFYDGTWFEKQEAKQQRGHTMKRIALLLLLAATGFITACDDHHNDPVDYDVYAPFSPVGIRTISLDNAVELRWIENQESDVMGYNVYVSSTYDGRYSLIGTSRTASYVDRGARNGTTYYYAVTAYDYSNNESELSKDVAYDTPRPEGRGVVLTDRVVEPTRGGYDFSSYAIIHYDTNETDLYFETSSGGVPYFVVWKDSDIQDLGYTKNIDEISVAPADGWNPTKDALIIKGHTYVVWTFDNHFAKVRVTDVTSRNVTFDWAYQTATGNPELFVRDKSGLKKTGRDRARERH